MWPLAKGASVTVAVIDTGVNAELPDLKPVVLPGLDLWAGSGDGRVDHGSEQGRGTAMAGLIASQGTKTGFVGIAPKATILPIAAPVSGRTTGQAVRFAVDRGAEVINISHAQAARIHRHQCPPELLEAIKYAVQKDVVIVANAGNTGEFSNEPLYPASCPGVVAVGALGRDGKPWKGTLRQSYVAVGAPGSGVGFIGKEGRVYTRGKERIRRPH